MPDDPQARKQGIAKPLIGETTLLGQKVVELAGDAANGVRGHVGLTVDAPIPAITQFRDKFQKRFGVAILSYAPFGYDAAWAAIHAMQKANSSDPKVYRAELKKVSFDGITGPIAFDDKGALKNASSTLYQVKNGAWVPIVTKSGT